MECDLDDLSFILVAATDLFLEPALITSNISSGLVTYTSVASETNMPLPFSSLTCKLFFLAVNRLEKEFHTIQEVLNLLHVNLHETALYVELNSLVCFLNLLKQVYEHSWKQTLVLVTVIISSLEIVIQKSWVKSSTYLHSECLATASLPVTENSTIKSIDNT